MAVSDVTPACDGSSSPFGITQPGDALEVRLIADQLGGVLEGEITYASIEAAAIEPGRLSIGPEGGRNLADRCLVELEAGHLGQHRGLPCLIAEPRRCVPLVARSRMQLAVATIREGAIATDPAATDGVEKATEQVD